MSTVIPSSAESDKPLRPRCRIPFSLRIFLALLTMLFVGNSLWFGVPFLRRYIAIRELQQMGGRLSFNRTGHATLRKYLGKSGMEAFDEVDWIYLDDTAFRDGNVKSLNIFTTIRGIDLEGTQVTDSGLLQFANFTRLESLHLSRTSITDAGLARASDLDNLTRLDLDDTRVGDVGLQYVGKIRNLRHLCAKGTDVTDAGLSHLSGMPELRLLFLDRTRVTDVGLNYLVDCKKLSFLFVNETNVTVEGAAQLRAALRRVDVFGPDYKSQIARLQELFPHKRFALPGSH